RTDHPILRHGRDRVGSRTTARRAHVRRLGRGRLHRRVDRAEARTGLRLRPPLDEPDLRPTGHRAGLGRRTLIRGRRLSPGVHPPGQEEGDNMKVSRRGVKPRHAGMALSLAVVLLAAACGGDNSKNTGATTTAAPGRQTTTAAAQTTTTAAPLSTAVGQLPQLPVPEAQIDTNATVRFSVAIVEQQLDPHRVTQSFNDHMFYDSIFQLDNSQHLIPALATGFKLSDDKKTMDITIRDGATFADGTP